jgi:hypothetical protein
MLIDALHSVREHAVESFERIALKVFAGGVNIVAVCGGKNGHRLSP